MQCGGGYAMFMARFVTGTFLIIALLTSTVFGQVAPDMVDEFEREIQSLREQMEVLNRRITNLQVALNAMRNTPPRDVAQLPAHNPKTIDEAGGFRFERKNCYIKSQFVECEVLITNQGRGYATIQINAHNPISWPTDYSGGRFPLLSVQEGGREAPYLSSQLAPETPTRFMFRFQAVPEEVRTLRRMEVGFYTNGRQTLFAFNHVGLLE
jgi:hypothetical protein